MLTSRELEGLGLRRIVVVALMVDVSVGVLATFEEESVAVVHVEVFDWRIELGCVVEALAKCFWCWILACDTPSAVADLYLCCDDQASRALLRSQPYLPSTASPSYTPLSNSQQYAYHHSSHTDHAPQAHSPKTLKSLAAALAVIHAQG